MQVAEPIVPIAKAARATGIPIRSLRRLVESGRCPSVVVGDTRRVRVSAVIGCIKESTTQPATSTV
jgi:hypothetical protein